MRPLRYSINVTLDGCCDHRVMIADEELHRHAVANLERADALLFGRVTYEMMEAAWRRPARTGARPDWMVPFARTIDGAKKYVVSGTLDRVDWNAELVRGDLGKAVQQLKREPGKGLFVGGVKLGPAVSERRPGRASRSGRKHRPPFADPVSTCCSAPMCSRCIDRARESVTSSPGISPFPPSRRLLHWKPRYGVAFLNRFA
jgi:hypothetical protein